MENVTCLGLPNCLRLANDEVEVVVTTDVGPRIIRYARRGGENVLGEFPDAAKSTALGEWKPWGGHRLWAAPEAVPRTYHPDNDPVAFEFDDRSVRLTAPVEAATGLEKEMVVSLATSGSEVVVRHNIANHSSWPIDLAPWALTVVRAGGVAIVPQEPYAPHGDETLLPVRTVVLWSYSDLSDPRFTLGRKYLRVTPDPEAPAAVKVGLSCSQGWVAYARPDALLLKRFPYEAGATYPDRGCNLEIYTAGGYTEIESLGPLRRVEPGERVEHVERWRLLEGIDTTGDDDALARALGPVTAG